MLDCKGNTVHFGDFLRLNQPGMGQEEGIYIRTINKGQPFPEHKYATTAGCDLIYCIGTKGETIAYSLNSGYFSIIESAREKPQRTESRAVSDFKPGDCIGLDVKPVPRNLCVLIKFAKPGEKLRQFGIDPQHLEVAVIAFIDTQSDHVKYVKYDINEHLYLYHSFLNSNISKPTTLDTSMYGSVCLDCGKPAYQPLIGKAECSDPNCKE